MGVSFTRDLRGLTTNAETGDDETTTKSVLDLYLAEIRKIPRLDPDEEARLARLAAQGDIKAKEDLIKANLWVVVQVAKRYAGCDLPLVDLIQEGNVGLLKAAEEFDWTQGHRLSTYAAWWIRSEILRALERGPVKIGKTLRKRARAIQRFSEEFFQERGRSPTVVEISRYMGLPESKVIEALRSLHPVKGVDYDDDEEVDAILITSTLIS